MSEAAYAQIMGLMAAAIFTLGLLLNAFAF
jgi:hypothetical protein